ncbi:tetratricopeptide repeat protein [Enterovirga sp.]|uniref:tetratricopeptide repeat protein n=1 Tax=Enterovirga sp. TaxID=2026350 RepID=UPI002BA96167|nr:tetratricopeptide repeat protein [Enterovirga sp.]HMO28750.1 tetratricopeptide repeat protein [Enterovirga sp.]
MDNFIREVDEEYRRERLAQIWKRFGAAIVALALLMVGGVGGWRYWQHRELARQEAAGARFAEAVQLSTDGKGEESEAVLKSLVGDGPEGYRLISRFRLAGELGKTGTGEEGAKAFDALAADASLEAVLRDLAKLRAAAIRLDSDSEAATRELEPIASPSNPMRHTARELLGLAALKRGDFEGASRWFDQIAQDRATPQNLRGRLEIYTALAAGGPVQVTQ